MTTAPTTSLSIDGQHTLAEAVRALAGHSGIYGIFHKNVPHRPYVGQAVDIGVRIAKHRREIAAGTHSHCWGMERFAFFSKEEFFTVRWKYCKPEPGALDKAEAEVMAEYPDAINSLMSDEKRGLYEPPKRPLSPAKLRRAAHVAKMNAIAGPSSSAVSEETQLAADRLAARTNRKAFAALAKDCARQRVYRTHESASALTLPKRSETSEHRTQPNASARTFADHAFPRKHVRTRRVPGCDGVGQG